MTDLETRRGPPSLPAGYLEFCASEAIRDLIRLYGFDAARNIVAEILVAEANGRRTKQ